MNPSNATFREANKVITLPDNSWKPQNKVMKNVIKIAMINVHQKLVEKNMRSKLLLQVHDELVLEIIKEEQEMVRNLVKNEMMNAVNFNVPLEVEIGIGENWLQAH